MTHQLINWGLGAITCIIVGSAYLLDGPSDLEAARATAAARDDAIKRAQIYQRWEALAAQVCGQNAAWTWTTERRTVQCTDKHGRKTIKAAL